jgi:hypothetical protein
MDGVKCETQKGDGNAEDFVFTPDLAELAMNLAGAHVEFTSASNVSVWIWQRRRRIPRWRRILHNRKNRRWRQ